MRLLMLAGILTLSSTPALAKNWVMVAKTPKSQFEIDFDSLERLGDGSRWKIWSRQITTNGKYVVQSVVDCRNRTVTDTFYAQYDGEGSVINSRSFGPYEREPQPAPPGTVLSAMIDRVCSN